MKNFIIIVALFLAGIAVAVVYLRSTGGPSPVAPAGESGLHGAEAAAAKGGPMCAKHHVPESIDAFCHPELVESLGFCKGHGVPEAFCTRCSPTLIAAFKAEGDWCGEHALPESQCKKCNPEISPTTAG